MNKLERLKPYKSADPMETVHRIRRILFENDIFVIESVQKRDPLTGVCSCRIILGDEGLRELNIGSNGKGMNTRYALASAYAEFMERLQSGAMLWKVEGISDTLPNAVPMTKEELEKAAGILMKLAYGESEDIDNIAKQYTSETENATAVTFTEYGTGKNVIFPSALLNKMTGSNGMASGNTVLEATIQGLSEIFEREAIQHLFLEKVTPPVIEEQIFEGTDVLDRLRRLKRAGINYRILDCSLGKGLPVIGLLIEKENRYHIHFGADPSPITALERCLTETFQGRELDNIPLYLPLEETEDRRVLFENERKEYTDSTGQVPVWLIDGQESWKFDGFRHPVSVSDEDDMAYYLQILDEMEKKLYVRECGFCGFPTVRLYVPGMTENHCPEPSYCLDKQMPKHLKEYMRRMPLLTDEEHEKLADGISQWLCEKFGINGAEDFISADSIGLKYIFPIGHFSGRQWDERLLVAAIYLRGGRKEQGMELLNRYISESGLSAPKAEMLRARLSSRALTFLPTEWSQCPDCSTCRAQNRCYQKKIEKWKENMNHWREKNET